MNAQEAFNGSLFGIRNQEYRRASNGAGCVYLVTTAVPGSQVGDRCGIGHIMSADLAEDALDVGDTILGLFQFRNAVQERVKHEFAGLDTGLLNKLQRAHDKYLAYSKAEYEQRMVEIAQEFHLHYTPPENTNVG